MATYSGQSGIDELKAKIRKKSEQLVQESTKQILTLIVDESPLGIDVYNSKHGPIYNDIGDFKNSWTVGIDGVDTSTRDADKYGAGALAAGYSTIKTYTLQNNIYVTNSIEYAKQVEYGWTENPSYGWRAKDGYHVVSSNVGIALSILQNVAKGLAE